MDAYRTKNWKSPAFFSIGAGAYHPKNGTSAAFVVLSDFNLVTTIYHKFYGRGNVLERVNISSGRESDHSLEACLNSNQMKCL